MRFGRVLLLLLATQGAGCTLLSRGVGNLSTRLEQSLEDCREQQRNRQFADQAWAEVTANHSGTYCEEYECGFKEGFVNYLYRGGDGEPPPVAPPQYRGTKYQTPDGYRRVECWFVAYRHGAARAMQSGCRDLVTGPSALRSLPPLPVYAPPAVPEVVGPPLAMPVPTAKPLSTEPPPEDDPPEDEPPVDDGPRVNWNVTSAPTSDEPPTAEVAVPRVNWDVTTAPAAAAAAPETAETTEQSWLVKVSLPRWWLADPDNDEPPVFYFSFRQ